MDNADNDRTNLIDGGIGNDTITVRDLTTHSAGVRTNDITGGSGNDVISSQILGNGQHLISGDGGHDLISDSLSGSVGDDTLSGNAGTDTFEFTVTSDYGDDVITDWNFMVDRLDVDLMDSNGNGLVDEFDALSSFSNIGADLVVSFDAGGSITFLGAGPATSIADIMDDPLTQLG